MCLLRLLWRVERSKLLWRTMMGMLCALSRPIIPSTLQVKQLPSACTRLLSLSDSLACYKLLSSPTPLTLGNPTGYPLPTSIRWSSLTPSTYCPQNSMPPILTLSMQELIHSKLTPWALLRCRVTNSNLYSVWLLLVKIGVTRLRLWSMSTSWTELPTVQLPGPRLLVANLLVL